MNLTPSRHPGYAIVLVAVIAHLIILVSIASQPLAVNAAPAERRSVVWALFHDAVHRQGPGVDFFAVYHAGVKARRGESPYEQTENPGVTPYYFPYRYLPAVAESLGRTVTLLPPRTGYVVWISILELMLAAFLVLFWQSTPGVPLRCLGSAVLLLNAPYFLELHMGQFTFATLALAGGAILLLARERRPNDARRALALGAAPYGLSVLLKVFPLIIAPALLREGRRGRLCLGIVAALLLLTNGPYFLRHPESWSSFYSANFGAESLLGGLNSGNFSLLYWIDLTAMRLGFDWTPESWTRFLQIWRAVVLLGTVGLVLVLRRPDFVLASVLLIFAHLLSYPHVWEHHYSGAVVIALIAVWRISQPGSPGRTLRTSMVVALILLALPSPFVLLDRELDPAVSNPSARWSSSSRALLPASKALPALFAYGLVLAVLLRFETSSRPRAVSDRGNLARTPAARRKPRPEKPTGPNSRRVRPRGSDLS